jgi:hypothetical protein
MQRLKVKKREKQRQGWPRLDDKMVTYVLVAALLCALAQVSSGQISPGELSGAHAQLEGVNNCTQCHSVGKAISDEHCLSCHREIKSRIEQKKGFHASIGAKHCFDCHKEHHGRQFEINRFDRKSFNHASVGFALEGKHTKLECEKCHTKDKVAAKDIQAFSDTRKQKTLLGLSQECITCHQDQHRGQLSQQCATCHTTDQWKPAPKFAHARAKFQLTGKHEKVECVQCHKNKLADGKTIQYVKMDFAACQACHADPHKGKFAQACTQCHTTDSFRQVKGAAFNHAITQFPLKEKHAAVKCEQCHASNPKAKNISGETGFHITKYRLCQDCHADAHARQFDGRADRGKCETCHTERTFTVVQYSAADHARTTFALAGAHLAVPCAKCHEAGKIKAKSSRQFHWESTIQCATCHSDVHKGQFAATMTNGCETCHTTESWQTVTFSHEKTKFPLKGKHAVIECSKCHKKTDAAPSVVNYAGTVTRCYECHTDEHDRQFAIAGVTRCERCHAEQGWKGLLFDHEKQTQFSLSGKHADVPCEKCHTPSVVNQRKIVRYKPLGKACIDCHQEK